MGNAVDYVVARQNIHVAEERMINADALHIRQHKDSAPGLRWQAPGAGLERRAWQDVDYVAAQELVLAPSHRLAGL